MKHIDEFIDDPRSDAYASFVFSMHRWPAITKAKCREYIAKHTLFCEFEGHVYKVVGCSRMGDVWLTQDFGSDKYQKRVDVDACSGWREGK